MRFESLLLDRAIPRGFVSPGDRDRIWERHILDSLRALQCLPLRPLTIVDVGSGAGLPGIPIAVARPDCPVILLEAKARRAAFLELAVEELGLWNTTVTKARVEESRIGADVAVARALADPVRTWKLCGPLTEPAGFVLYFAGASGPLAASGSLGDLMVEFKICAQTLFPWEGPVIKMVRMREPLTGA
jgi:16S rRNA (guanine527-N7)-methyltransferase